MQKVDFTKKYYQTPARFVAKTGTIPDISKEALAGKKVGVQRATTHDSFLTDNFGDAVEVVRYATQDEANLDLVAGRVDLLLADSVTLSEGLLKTDQGKGFAFVGPAYSDPKWFGHGVRASRSASPTTICATSSTRRSTRSGPTAPGTRSRPSTSTSTSTAADMPAAVPHHRPSGAVAALPGKA